MKTVILFGWAVALASLASVIAGHFGNHDLNWRAFQISSYAAASPLDYLITLSMTLSAVTLIVIGVLASKYKVLGDSLVANFVPIISGAAASGLLLLAKCEETATSISALKKLSFLEIRIQSFHDAGLLIFFYNSILLVTLSGILFFICRKRVVDKCLSATLFGMGPCSYFFMSGAWPKYLGFQGVTVGINQRASLFCLWLAIVLFLILASKKRQPEPARELASPAGKR